MGKCARIIKTLIAFGIGCYLGRRSIKIVAEELEQRNDDLINTLNKKMQMADNERDKLVFDRDRYKLKWRILTDWTRINKAGRTVSSFFKEKGIMSIGIYGLGELGIFLVDELTSNEETAKITKYIVDKNKHGLSYKGIPIISPTDSLDKVDCIVVCTVMNMAEVKRVIGDENELVRLQDIIKECIDSI